MNINGFFLCLSFSLLLKDKETKPRLQPNQSMGVAKKVSAVVSAGKSVAPNGNTADTSRWNAN